MDNNFLSVNIHVYYVLLCQNFVMTDKIFHEKKIKCCTAIIDRVKNAMFVPKKTKQNVVESANILGKPMEARKFARYDRFP